MNTDTMQTPSRLIEQGLNCIKEATIGISDITDNQLRSHLRQLISNELGNESCFLADPVVEHTFGWKSADRTSADLVRQNLSSTKFTDVLVDADRYGFPKTARPYVHQSQAWKHLLGDAPKSATIMSGTGSDKTECFMIPTLEDLMRRQMLEKAALISVQALFLYPFNVLTNFQKERLDVWTKPFGNKIRPYPYNGNTKESAETRDKNQPN